MIEIVATNVFVCCQYKEGIFIKGGGRGQSGHSTMEVMVLGAQWKNKSFAQNQPGGV